MYSPILEFRLYLGVTWVCIAQYQSNGLYLIKALDTKQTDRDPLIMNIDSWVKLPLNEDK